MSNCSSLESVTIPFVGDGSSTNQYPFGFIFGTSGYTGGTATLQRYKQGDEFVQATFYIPSTLRSVTVTGGNIPYGAFYNCSKLTSITVGNAITSIEDDAFRNCSNLTSITLGNSVTSIGAWAFDGCGSLTSVYYTGDIASWCGITFSNSISNPLS